MAAQFKVFVSKLIQHQQHVYVCLLITTFYHLSVVRSINIYIRNLTRKVSLLSYFRVTLSNLDPGKMYEVIIFAENGVTNVSAQIAQSVSVNIITESIGESVDTVYR